MMDAVLSYSHQETDEPTDSVSSSPVKLLVGKAEMHTQAYTSKAKRCHYDTPTRKCLQVMIPTGSSPAVAASVQLTPSYVYPILYNRVNHQISDKPKSGQLLFLSYICPNPGVCITIYMLLILDFNPKFPAQTTFICL